MLSHATALRRLHLASACTHAFIIVDGGSSCEVSMYISRTNETNEVALLALLPKTPFAVPCTPSIMQPQHHIRGQPALNYTRHAHPIITMLVEIRVALADHTGLSD